VPVGIAHEGANRHDQKLLAETLGSIPIERPKPTPQTPHGLCLDRAYDAPAMHELAIEHGLTPHIFPPTENTIALRWRTASCARS
jgi:putative transposase